ncbi:MAG: hypothetical protein IBX55_16745 [Methyloprofundus sp.]|nr:hypothetical protein [Methyloprofundus sp.]
MGLFNTLFGWFGTSSTDYSIESSVNPANGLPMMGGIGGVDVEGNPYGTDLHNDTFNDFGSMDDTLSSMFDDSFSDSLSDPFDSFDSMGGFNDDF